MYIHAYIHAGYTPPPPCQDRSSDREVSTAGVQSVSPQNGEDIPSSCHKSDLVYILTFNSSWLEGIETAYKHALL